MKDVIEEVLVKFINHYEEREIRKTYIKNEWTPEQIASAFIKSHKNELNKLLLHGVVKTSRSEIVAKGHIERCGCTDCVLLRKILL